MRKVGWSGTWRAITSGRTGALNSCVREKVIDSPKHPHFKIFDNFLFLSLLSFLFYPSEVDDSPASRQSTKIVRDATPPLLASLADRWLQKQKIAD